MSVIYDMKSIATPKHIGSDKVVATFTPPKKVIVKVIHILVYNYVTFHHSLCYEKKYVSRLSAYQI